MKNWKIFAFSSLLFLCMLTSIGKPCTSFCLNDNGNLIFGTNFDNDRVHKGLLFVNNRKVSKTGWESSTTGEYAGWISKYGSVTFNLAGYQLVWAGINEEGLVVSTMALSGTQSPPPDTAVRQRRLPARSGSHTSPPAAAAATRTAADSCGTHTPGPGESPTRPAWPDCRQSPTAPPVPTKQSRPTRQRNRMSRKSQSYLTLSLGAIIAPPGQARR